MFCYVCKIYLSSMNTIYCCSLTGSFMNAFLCSTVFVGYHTWWATCQSTKSRFTMLTAGDCIIDKILFYSIEQDAVHGRSTCLLAIYDGPSFFRGSLRCSNGTWNISCGFVCFHCAGSCIDATTTTIGRAFINGCRRTSMERINTLAEQLFAVAHRKKAA